MGTSTFLLVGKMSATKPNAKPKTAQRAALANSTANYAKRAGDRGAPGSQITSSTRQKCKADNS